MIVEAEREPLQVGKHVGADQKQNLLTGPGHGPDLPVLRLPHGDINKQKDDAHYAQAKQVMARDIIVDRQADQERVRQMVGVL